MAQVLDDFNGDSYCLNATGEIYVNLASHRYVLKAGTPEVVAGTRDLKFLYSEASIAALTDVAPVQFTAVEFLTFMKDQ